MLDVTKLSAIGIDDVAAVPPDTILAVDNDGNWSVLVKRALRTGRNGWSYTERVDQLGVIRSTLEGGTSLHVYDPQLDHNEFASGPDIYRVFAVGDEPAALGRIVAWTDDSYGRSAAILVSVDPRQYRGTACSYTRDDTKASFLRALKGRSNEPNLSSLAIYAVPLGWD